MERGIKADAGRLKVGARDDHRFLAAAQVQARCDKAHGTRKRREAGNEAIDEFEGEGEFNDEEEPLEFDDEEHQPDELERELAVITIADLAEKPEKRGGRSIGAKAGARSSPGQKAKTTGWSLGERSPKRPRTKADVLALENNFNQPGNSVQA